MNLNLAANAQESWIIRAPYDWVVLSKAFEVGMVVWSWMPIFKFTSSESMVIEWFIEI